MQATAASSSKRQLEVDSYLTRARAAETLTAAGIPTTKRTLEYLAIQKSGPPYRVVNGRAVYARAGLLEWIEGHRASPSARRGVA